MIRFKSKADMIERSEFSFIRKWIVDENIRCYEFVNLLSPPEKCLENTFNLWNGFNIEDEPNENCESCEILLDHIK